MAIQVDWCSRCAAAIYDEDGIVGGCSCPDGQLKQLLAAIRGPQKTTPKPAAVSPKSTPRTAAMDDAELASIFLRGGEETPAESTVSELEGLWSHTDNGEDPAGPVASETGLEALWMGRVTAETGMSAPDLESIWLNEIGSESGSTVASTAHEITFDDLDIDAELSQHRAHAPVRAERFRVDRPPTRAPISGPRVQVGQAGRFSVMAEAETISTRQAARAAAVEPRVPPPVAPRGPSVQSFREVRASREAASRAPAVVEKRPSAFERAAEYANRQTVYQRLMNDD